MRKIAHHAAPQEKFIVHTANSSDFISFWIRKWRKNDQISVGHALLWSAVYFGCNQQGEGDLRRACRVAARQIQVRFKSLVGFGKKNKFVFFFDKEEKYFPYHFNTILVLWMHLFQLAEMPLCRRSKTVRPRPATASFEYTSLMDNRPLLDCSSEKTVLSGWAFWNLSNDENVQTVSLASLPLCV